MRKSLLLLGLAVLLGISACKKDEEEDGTPSNTGLTIPAEYSSADYDANAIAEGTVIDELATMTAAANDAEANAQGAVVSTIDYPNTLESVSLSNYSSLISDWLVELVNAANSQDGFQNPGLGNMPAMGQEGGLLGSRLLDENGLELEQMLEKGSFGAALYNHAVAVIEGDLSDSGIIDKLVEIHGTDAEFDPNNATAAAKYAKRRSNNDARTGFFWDIKRHLITAKAAIEAGSGFNSERNEALDGYLLSWEKSNFATVIYYCNATKVLLQDAAQMADGPDKDAVLGNAMHAYAEGVAFAHGFKGLSRKQITDAEIDSILTDLLAPEGQNPESHRFLNEASLLNNFNEVVELIQNIYGFTDEEVESFFVNN